MSDDAWKQHFDLLEQFTQSREVRPDLKVIAHACDRTVSLHLGTPNDSHRSLIRYHWKSTQRNVRTMRELAHALLDACDFVEASNPVWASHTS